MAEFKRVIQRTTNSERIESGVAQLEVNEFCIVEDGEEVIYKNKDGEYVSISKDKYTVGTIKELKSSKKYKVGDVVQVLGYYTPGDGGGHPRKACLEDDGTGVQLANKLYANIIHKGKLNVSWLGANGDIECAGIFQKAIDMNVKVTARKGVTYNINTPINIKGTVDIDLNNAYLTTNVEGMTILYNSDNDPINGTIENIRFADWRQAGEKKKFTGVRIGYTTRGMNIRNLRGTHVDRILETGDKIWGKLDIDGLQCQNTIYDDSITVLLKGNAISCRNFDIIGNMEACIKHLGGRPFHLSDSNLAGGSITNAIHMTNVSEYELNNIYIEKVKTVSALTDEGIYIKGGRCGTVREINMAGGNIVLDSAKVNLSNITFSQTNRGLRFKNNSVVNISENVNGFFNANNSAEIYQGKIIYANNQSNKPIVSKFFEVNAESVRASNAGLTTVERVSSDFLTSGYSLKVSSTVESWQGVYFDFIPTSNGLHTAIAKIKIKSTSGSVKISGGSTYTAKPYESTSIKDEWIRISCILDCVAGQTHRFNITHVDLPIGESFYIDNIGIFYGVNYSDIEGYYEPTTLESLDTPYYVIKMQQEKIYQEYVTYRDELHEYDYKQREIEKQKQLAYEEELKENPNLTYEEFLENLPMLLPILEEPQPSEALIAFKEKYLG